MLAIARERSKQLEYNLAVLKRRDAAIQRVLDMAGHVVLYQFNEESKVVKKLVKALTDKDDQVWRLAVEIATLRKFEAAEKELDKQLGKAKRDEERMVPLLVALSAIRGDDPEWQATLEGYATGDAREVRNAALRALAQHGGLDYLSVLRQALEHRDWSTRLAALYSTQKIVVATYVFESTEKEEPLLARMRDIRAALKK